MSHLKVAIVTGASSGIGAAAARQFTQAGYRVVLSARRLERLQELAAEIEAAGGQALAVATDVSDIASIQAMVQTTLDTYGQIDVLFNNAGFGRTKWLEEMDPVRDIQAQIQVNVLGVIQTTRAVLPHMIERRSGSIVNMASMAGHIGTPTYTIYAASKFAVRGFSEALRREVGVWGIKVSVIYPGGVKTEFAKHTQAKRKTGIKTPDALMLSPEDVARAVVRVAEHPRIGLIMPWYQHFGAWINALFPRLNDWLIERTFTKPERGM